MSVAIFILEEKLGIEVIMNCFLMCLVLLCPRPDCPAPAADSDGVSLEKKKLENPAVGKRPRRGRDALPGECRSSAAPPGLIDNNPSMTPLDTNSSFHRKNNKRSEAGERRHVVEKAPQGSGSREQPGRRTVPTECVITRQHGLF